MGKCNLCIINEPIYEVRFEGTENERVLEQVVRVLGIKQVLLQQEGKQIRMREAGMWDFYDFCVDHLRLEQIWFRAESEDEWRPIGLLPDILKVGWVDRLIQEQRIVSWAQPIVDQRGELYGHEILARFVQPDGTLISPAEVFAAAKLRNRLYVLDRMCRMAAIKSAVHLPQKVFINFIPTSIYSPEHCLQSTITLSHELGFDAAKFVFEVVESEYVEDLAHLKSILDYYRERGFQYALDDVGSGFSTVELLQDLKPHYMKLDKSFVQGVAREKEKQDIATRLLHAAGEVGAIPLAEGIETEEDLAWLRHNGFQLFQGYLIGRPEPVHPVG